MAETARIETLKRRAELIVEYERTMEKRELANKEWHPIYLHVLLPKYEVDDKVSADDVDVIDGVKRLLALQRKESEGLMGGLESTMDGRIGSRATWASRKS